MTDPQPDDHVPVDDLSSAPSRRSNATIAGHDLVVVDGAAVRVVALPDRGSLVIGRGHDADVALDSAQVSRRHAVLHVDPIGFAIEDLGSANGTSTNVGGLGAGAPCSIGLGEPVRVGEFVLVVTPRVAAPSSHPSDEPDLIVAQSEASVALVARIACVAPSDLGVLLRGEPGTGKDRIARHIHAQSPRRDRRFLRLPCRELPTQLLETELFGHEQGGPGGAGQPRPGLLELADGGTVFLDDIGELPAYLQPRLLQALETREVTRVGGTTPRPIDVRIIAATSHPLDGDIAAKRFRPELYFRLAALSIDIPPLRDRGDDILPLACDLLQAAAHGAGAPVPRITDDTAALLRAYRWPGNVRELRHTMTRALVLGGGSAITPALLPAAIRAAPIATTARVACHDASGWSAPELEERTRIIDALVHARGNQSRAARALGISRSTLLHRLDIYRIMRPRKRPGAPS